MEINNISTNMTLGRVQEEAGMSVQAMAINNMRQMGEDVANIMDSAQVISDPALGNNIDIFG